MSSLSLQKLCFILFVVLMFAAEPIINGLVSLEALGAFLAFGAVCSTVVALVYYKVKRDERG